MSNNERIERIREIAIALNEKLITKKQYSITIDRICNDYERLNNE
jgi:hypothetical protein